MSVPNSEQTIEIPKSSWPYPSWSFFLGTEAIRYVCRFFWGGSIICFEHTLEHQLPAPVFSTKGTMAKQPVPTASKRAVRPNLFCASRSARRFSNNLVASGFGERSRRCLYLRWLTIFYDVVVGASSFHFAKLNMKTFF